MDKVIIFDFDGTIADTLESVVKIVNKNADHFGHKKVTKEDIPYLQGKKPREILSYLGISILKFPFWIKRIHSEMNKEISNLTPTVNIFHTISELKQENHLGILTSNTLENVKKFLSKNDLDVFDFIYTEKSVFGKSHVINKIAKTGKFDKNKMYYVCDEVRDIEAAKKSRVKSIAVTWGYNSKKALEKEGPDFLVDKPEEIPTVIKKT